MLRQLTLTIILLKKDIAHEKGNVDHSFQLKKKGGSFSRSSTLLYIIVSKSAHHTHPQHKTLHTAHTKGHQTPRVSYHEHTLPYTANKIAPLATLCSGLYGLALKLNHVLKLEKSSKFMSIASPVLRNTGLVYHVYNVCIRSARAKAVV